MEKDSLPCTAERVGDPTDHISASLFIILWILRFRSLLRGGCFFNLLQEHSIELSLARLDQLIRNCWGVA